MTEVIVRPFENGDEIDMCALHIASIRELNSKDYIPEVIAVWSDKRPEQYLESMVKNNEKFHIVEVDGKILGFSGWYGEGIIGFYMHPDYAGKGLGRKLFEVTETDFWQNSGQEVCKITSTITAKPFYERMGFQVIKPGTHTLSKSKITIDVWHLEKKK